MEQAIKIAIEYGWNSENFMNNETHLCNAIFLDHLFWQALGKGLGWYELNYKLSDPIVKEVTIHELQDKSWKAYWHRFIDHLSEGKDINSFFEELIK